MPPKLTVNQLAEQLADLKKKLANGGAAADAADPGTALVIADLTKSAEDPAEQEPTILSSVVDGLGEVWSAFSPWAKSAFNDTKTKVVQALQDKEKVDSDTPTAAPNSVEARLQALETQGMRTMVTTQGSNEVNSLKRDIEVLQAHNGEFQRANASYVRERTQMEKQMEEMQRQLDTFKRETETWKVGAWVWAVYPKDKHAYAATVETVNDDGTFNISWCDGDPAPLLGYKSHQLMERIEPYAPRPMKKQKSRAKAMPESPVDVDSMLSEDCKVLDKYNKLLPYDTLLSLYHSWGDGMKHALYIALRDHYNVRMLPEEDSSITTIQLLQTAQSRC